MLDEALQEHAAIYACGAMDSEERAHFELVLEFHSELRQFVRELHEVSAGACAPEQRSGPQVPSGELKARILNAVSRCQQSRQEGFVMTNLEGLVQWVNPAFVEMCGYALEELAGRKLGPILQGELSDSRTVERLRRAVHQRQACTEEIVNYTKQGRPYWVSINILPVEDHHREVRWLIAREREIFDRPLPV